MVLLVDYSKRKADTSDAEPSQGHKICDHLLCHPETCQHPEDKLRQEATQLQIRAAEEAAAKEEADEIQDEMPSLLDSHSHSRSTALPRNRRHRKLADEGMPRGLSPLRSSRTPSSNFFKRCETSELVREHRNRRPTVLTENEMSHSNGLDLDLSNSNTSLFSHDEILSLKPKKTTSAENIDWSQPSRRTVPKGAETAEFKPIKRPTLGRRSVSDVGRRSVKLGSAAAGIPTKGKGLGDSITIQDLNHETDQDQDQDANSTQSRGCVSLSNLYTNHKNLSTSRLSFTLRRPTRDSSSRSLTSVSSVTRLEQSLTNLDASLQSQDSAVAANIVCPHSHKSQIKGCNICTKQQTHSPTPVTGHFRSRSMSQSNTIPAKIKLDMDTSFASTRPVVSSRKDNKTPPRRQPSNSNLGDTTNKTKTPKRLSHSLSPKRTSTSSQKLSLADNNLEALQSLLRSAPPRKKEETEDQNHQPNAADNALLTKRKKKKPDIIPSSHELGYGEDPIPTPVPLTVQISANFQMNSTDALPGNLSDDESLSELEDDDNDDDDEDQAPAYAPQYSPKRPARRCISMSHQTLTLSPLQNNSSNSNNKNSSSSNARRRLMQRSSSLQWNGKNEGTFNLANPNSRRGSMASGRSSKRSSTTSKSSASRRRRQRQFATPTGSALDMTTTPTTTTTTTTNNVVKNCSGFVTGSRIRRIDSSAPKLSKR